MRDTGYRAHSVGNATEHAPLVRQVLLCGYCNAADRSGGTVIVTHKYYMCNDTSILPIPWLYIATLGTSWINPLPTNDLYVVDTPTSSISHNNLYGVSILRINTDFLLL